MKRLTLYLSYLFVMLFGVSCSNSVDVSSTKISEFSQDTYPGMVRVKANGKMISLGTNELAAKANERPVMRANFSYDFSIGKHEVTCADFSELMKPLTGLTLACDQDSLPASDLTYYDAILYINAYSKAENLDTAYTYVKASFDAEKHCTNLEGFAFHPEVETYRLPTEAEWVYVASRNWNVKKSWHAENSDYKLHPVCSIEMPENAPCDMVGNVMEWVNDWLGNFRDTSVTNYVGAPDGGALGLRVVKGASFRNAGNSIALYSRGDVYTVTSATRANYVGFRMALGAIPDAVWLSSSGNVIASRVLPLAGASTVRSLTGSFETKLAFRNDITGNLAFVDYSGGTNSVTEIADTLDVYHPEISPDGKRVAFCTGLEGVSGKSTLYVRDLNGQGTGLVKLDVESAAIPRWRVLENGDTVIVFVTDAGNNKNESAFKSASTWQVKFAEGKFAKPEKLFDGAYHGGISDDGSLAVTGARILRAHVSNRDTVWYNGEQACNVSLSKDGSKRTLFLDFGGKTGREFVGENYGTHERLFVVDAQGNLIQSVAAPSGYSFDHSEWASNGDLVVATLTSANGAHQKMVLVNMADSSMTELLEGDELWHPSLWVAENGPVTEKSLLNLDSAGVYYVEGQSWDHQVMGVKMGLFWENINRIEILCVGSSRIEDGIIALNMSSGVALNMGHPGNDLNAALYVAENYGLPHLAKLKAVVVSLDIDLWQVTTEYTQEMFGWTPGFVYDADHQFWKDEIPYGFIDAVRNAMVMGEAYKTYYESMGFAANQSGSWGSPDVEKDSTWQYVSPTTIEWNLKRLQSFIEKADEFGVVVVGVIFPQNPGYRNTGAWGRYGPTRTVAGKTLENLKQLDASHPNFILLNENKMGKHDYSDEMALNTDHLNELGARQLTERLDALLRTLK